MNYTEIDEFLIWAKSKMITEAQKRDITEYYITVWRWNIPEVLFIWQTGEIGRNVYVIVKEKERDNINRRRVRIECNAWKDYDLVENERSVRMRKWKNNEIAILDFNMRKKIEIKIGYAFDKVLDLKKGDLGRPTEIEDIYSTFV